MPKIPTPIAIPVALGSAPVDSEMRYSDSSILLIEPTKTTITTTTTTTTTTRARTITTTTVTSTTETAKQTGYTAHLLAKSREFNKNVKSTFDRFVKGAKNVLVNLKLSGEVEEERLVSPQRGRAKTSIEVTPSSGSDVGYLRQSIDVNSSEGTYVNTYI